jgi:hypothetical protein
MRDEAVELTRKWTGQVGARERDNDEEKGEGEGEGEESGWLEEVKGGVEVKRKEEEEVEGK